MISENSTIILSNFSQALGTIGFLLYIILRIRNYAPKDVRLNDKFIQKKNKKKEELSNIYQNGKYTKENIKDHMSIVNSKLTTSTNNTNAVLFFVPFVYGIITPYLNFPKESIDALNQFIATVILFIAFFLYPYLGFKSDTTYDLKVELRVLEDMLEDLD